MEDRHHMLDYADIRGYRERMLRGTEQLPPLIITVALTGAFYTKEANPNLPETAEEQAQSTYEAYRAGASVVHVHCRQRANPHEMSDDPEEYRRVNAMIREKCPDIVIGDTAAGGRIRYGEKLSELMVTSIYAKPEIASFDTSNYSGRVVRPGQAPLEISFSLTPGEAEQVAKLMKENGVKPEYEIFDIGDLRYIEDLAASGFAEPPHWIQLLVHPGANFPSPLYLLTMLQHTPPGSLVSVIGIGRTQLAAITMAILLGCHVRVGMEDNLYYAKGQLAESNAQFVERVVRIAKELGREIATPKQAREMLGLPEAPRQYS